MQFSKTCAQCGAAAGHFAHTCAHCGTVVFHEFRGLRAALALLGAAPWLLAALIFAVCNPGRRYGASLDAPLALRGGTTFARDFSVAVDSRTLLRLVFPPSVSVDALACLLGAPAEDPADQVPCPAGKAPLSFHWSIRDRGRVVLDQRSQDVEVLAPGTAGGSCAQAAFEGVPGVTYRLECTVLRAAPGLRAVQAHLDISCGSVFWSAVSIVLSTGALFFAACTALLWGAAGLLWWRTLRFRRASLVA